MTTIHDPLGSPTITYNASGKNIQSVSAGAGTTFAVATTITHVSEFTVLLVDGGANNISSIAFDANFQVGDIVAINFTNGNILNVYASDGSGLGGPLSTAPAIQYVKSGSGAHDWTIIAS